MSYSDMRRGYSDADSRRAVDRQVRRVLASSPDAPQVAGTVQGWYVPLGDLLERLAEDDDPRVRFYVARNPNTPGHLLERLADDPDVLVRGQVAENLNTPGHLLERLADDEDPYVTAFVAENPNTPAHVRERFS